MNREETVGVLRLLRTAYPGSYRNMSAEDQALTLDLFATVYRSVSVEQVTQAVLRIIQTEDREFSPGIAHINRYIVSSQTTTTTPEAEWETLRTTLRSLPSDRPSDIVAYWEKLSPIVRKIYSVHDMVDMAFHRTSAELSTYEKPRFVKAYNEYSSAEAQILTLALMHGSSEQIEHKGDKEHD